MTDYRRERHRYVGRAGVDEGGHGLDGKTVLLKRDAKKAGEEEDWKNKTRDSGCNNIQ